ncbi:MAG TPA: hypothetical protein VIV55_06630 [Flavobacterium sp.]
MAITPTAITSEDQIYLASSPINLRIRNLAADNTIQSVVCELYVWSGNLKAPPSLANYTLVADKARLQDDYINFQNSEIIASHITGIRLAWIGDQSPIVSGEGVFFQYKYQVTSNAGIEAPIELPTNFATMGITPTTITSEDQIYLAGSPINLRINNLAADNTILSVVCWLYIWRGNLNEPPTLPNYTLAANKVRLQDDYINFQNSEIIASHINGTRLAWIGDQSPIVSGEGVFFQYKYQVTSNAGIEDSVTLPANFATMGWRFDFEQVGQVSGITVSQPYLGLLPINYSRNYTNRIKYFKRNFDFTKSLEDCTSENIISSTPNIPTQIKCQLGDKYLVVYINRLGLWDYFTPYGKAINSTKVSADTNPRLYRNPNSINNNINHSKTRSIDQSEQTYTLNSGDLHESMVDQIEEVIYSPLVYLIEFTGDIYKTVQVGLTVDNTIVTVDSTIYTVDNDVVTEDDLGLFSTFRQIPVTCETTSFTRKTRLNDKGKINYELNFNVTSGRINQLK